MKLIGRNGNNLIVEVEKDELKYFSLKTDIFDKPIDISLKESNLDSAKENLIKAKKDLEFFIQQNKSAFNNIVTAGTLVGTLFENKQNKLSATKGR